MTSFRLSKSRAFYRSRQVMHALWPRIPAEDLDFAATIMNHGERRLFAVMERRDQRHALEVMRRLRAGIDDRDVLIAALLHDCGKGPVPVWLRVLRVIAPGALARFAREGATGSRGAAHRLIAHAEIGAGLAEAAGSSAVTVRLIAGRPAPAEAWKAALLQAADDAS